MKLTRRTSQLLLLATGASAFSNIYPPRARFGVPVSTSKSSSRIYSAPPKKPEADTSVNEGINPHEKEITMEVEADWVADNTASVLDELSKAEKLSMDDSSNYVCVNKEEAKNDFALNLMSSELGVNQFLGREMDPVVELQSILFERSLDTVEDILVHLRRIPYAKGWIPKPMEMCSSRKTVVVLGSGWAAHALMKVADCMKIKLIVVSPSNHFVFTPMLASAAAGKVEFSSMTEATRSSNPMIDQFIEGAATKVDVKNKKVTVKLNSLLEDVAEGEPPEVELDYDHLIVSVGVTVADSGVPGAAKRCFKLKTCNDARRLRTAVGEAFEYASRPDVRDESHKEERSRRVTFFIVGGGPTGVELAGELSDLAKDITKERTGSYPRLHDDVQVVLAHGGAELLPQFDKDLRKEAKRSLEDSGIDVKLNTRVSEVGQGFVKLSTKVLDADGSPTGERTESIMPVGLTVWCAGNAPQPFTSELLKELPESAKGPEGKVNVDRWLRPPMPSKELEGSVMVLGDAAGFADKSQSFLPQTAQVAGQQGAYAARLLVRGYDLTATPPALPIETDESMPQNQVDAALAEWLKLRNLEKAPGFSFLNLGLLAYVGGGEALSQVQLGNVPVFSWAGSVAYVLWRSVYLVKQVATRNRVLVTFDWVKTALFGRDVTRL